MNRSRLLLGICVAVLFGSVAHGMLGLGNQKTSALAIPKKQDQRQNRNSYVADHFYDDRDSDVSSDESMQTNSDESSSESRPMSYLSVSPSTLSVSPSTTVGLDLLMNCIDENLPYGGRKRLYSSAIGKEYSQKFNFILILTHDLECSLKTLDCPSTHTVHTGTLHTRMLECVELFFKIVRRYCGASCFENDKRLDSDVLEYVKNNQLIAYQKIELLTKAFYDLARSNKREVLFEAISDYFGDKCKGQLAEVTKNYDRKLVFFATMSKEFNNFSKPFEHSKPFQSLQEGLLAWAVALPEESF